MGFFCVVSIHAPARGATFAMQRAEIRSKFQSTHPHGVRPNKSVRVKHVSLFQSTHPHGVRRIGNITIPKIVKFQSTHPHGVRHLADLAVKQRGQVSIHAPARGATHFSVDKDFVGLFQSTHPHGVRRINSSTLRRRSEFQSTHPHGVRPMLLSIKIKTESFNPRTRTGCDVVQRNLLEIAEVSIHAPARGATWLDAIDERQEDMFQSTHPHGVRQHSCQHSEIVEVFQSTHPHGVRQVGFPQVQQAIVFQSTHPHGVRLTFNNSKNSRKMFQSTHPHGVRREKPVILQAI